MRSLDYYCTPLINSIVIFLCVGLDSVCNDAIYFFLLFFLCFFVFFDFYSMLVLTRDLTITILIILYLSIYLTIYLFSINFSHMPFIYQNYIYITV